MPLLAFWGNSRKDVMSGRPIFIDLNRFRLLSIGKKIGRVLYYVTLEPIKSAFILDRRNTFFEMVKKLNHQEHENKVTTL